MASSFDLILFGRLVHQIYVRLCYGGSGLASHIGGRDDGGGKI